MKGKSILISVMLVITLMLAACGGQSNSAEPETQNDVNDMNTASNDLTEDESQPEPEAEEITPAVEVMDQEIVNDSVIIPSVTMDRNGWVVIHTTSAEGTPGPVIGHAPVSAGTNGNVAVSIQADLATPQLFAMLHTDAGNTGTYEFPGDDGPVKNGDNIVMKPFNLNGLQASISVSDQEAMDGSIVVDSAFMLQSGWVVIHTTSEEGGPGPVVGYAPLPAGPSTDVTVSIDVEQSTPQLFAMLHIDAGETGTYEFPGDDGPVREGDAVVMEPFAIEGITSEASDDSAMNTGTEITIENFSFSPSNLEVKIGTTVTWTNNDSAAHTATADDGAFDSGTLGNGESFSFTFNDPGTFSYFCTFHPNMTATITVVP
jgi:plastocyanin